MCMDTLHDAVERLADTRGVATVWGPGDLFLKWGAAINVEVVGAALFLVVDLSTRRVVVVGPEVLFAILEAACDGAEAVFALL